MQHGKLTRHLVGDHRYVHLLAYRADHIEVGQPRLDHHHVRALVHVGVRLA
jgi:hypothetical protein